MPLLQLGQKHSVSCRRGWESAAKGNLGMEEWMRAGTRPGMGSMDGLMLPLLSSCSGLTSASELYTVRV